MPAATLPTMTTTTTCPNCASDSCEIAPATIAGHQPLTLIACPECGFEASRHTDGEIVIHARGLRDAVSMMRSEPLAFAV